MSMPHSDCWRTTSLTACLHKLANACSSYGSPATCACISFNNGCGRARLPTCVVKMRCVLRCIPRRLSQAAGRTPTYTRMTRIGAEPKPPWRVVPSAVKAQVEDRLGAPVERALRVWGGYAPSPTFRLFLGNGRRVFFKGVNPTSNEHMHRALVAEERVYRELTPWIRPWAPQFLDSLQCADWHVLLLEDVAGTRVPPWTSRRVQIAMYGYAAFHRYTLGQDLPD